MVAMGEARASSQMLTDLLAALHDDRLSPRYEQLYRIFAASIMLQEGDGKGVSAATAIRDATPTAAAPDPGAVFGVHAITHSGIAIPINMHIADARHPSRHKLQCAGSGPMLAASPACAALLTALLRWGGQPLAVQTVLSAYTAAALCTARLAALPAAAPDAAASQAARFEASMQAAESAVGSLQGLQTDVQLLRAAWGVLGHTQQEVSVPQARSGAGLAARFRPGARCAGASDGAGASAVAPRRTPSALDAARTYWFDPDRGLRMVSAAATVWDAAAGKPCGPQEVAAAVAAALARGAGGGPGVRAERAGQQKAAGGEGGRSDGAAGQLQELAFALLVQPAWRDLCSKLGAPPRKLPQRGGCGVGEQVAGAATAATAAAAAEQERRSGVCGAAAALAAELAAALQASPAALLAWPPAPAAAACWAHESLASAVSSALASDALVQPAAANAAAAGGLQDLVMMLHTLGCLG